MGSLTESQQKLLHDVVAAIDAFSQRSRDREIGHDVSSLKRDYDIALRLSEVIHNAEALDDFSDAADLDVIGWLLDLPFELARAGLAFEAINLQAVWARIDERANFLADRAVLLAEAGMKEEATAQIAELNKEFPDDIWVQIKIGDSWWALKDLDKAEERFRWALGAALRDYEREGARERLIDLLKEQGKTDDALKLDEQSPVMEELRGAIREGDYLTGSQINLILANRKLFQPYLRNALANRASIGSVREEPIDWTDSQAIFLLSEMGDTSIIPDVIRCLSMSEQDLDALYGDMLTENMWIPFATVGYNHLDDIWKFVTDETAYLYARGAAVTGVVAMHHFHPDCRAETVSFMNHLLDRVDVFPVDHLAGFLCDCADSGLTELAGPAEEFASRMGNHGTSYAVATAEDIREAFRAGAREDFISRRASDVYDVNEQWRRVMNSQEMDEFVDEEEESIVPPKAIPAISEKIGRNDPCPCGSGKKYKKCHGK